jgi:hypothetical protein
VTKHPKDKCTFIGPLIILFVQPLSSLCRIEGIQAVGVPMINRLEISVDIFTAQLFTMTAAWGQGGRDGIASTLAT